MASTPTSAAAPPLLRVEDLHTHFPVRGGAFGGTRRVVKAVDGVSFDLHAGRTLGLVGESGCGKSTLARTILRLIPATAGRVLFEGRDVFRLSATELRGLRRRMQIIFQDPMSSLNPRLRVEDLVGEALAVHGLVRNRRELRERVATLLHQVGLSTEDLRRFPHEFSGGQRQRIGIARALALSPRLVICDEPVSALDVSIQAQILNLLAELQARLGLTYVFVSHNLAVVQHVSDEVAVMYLGRIVEIGPAADVYANPRHPYTRVLLAAAPRVPVASQCLAPEAAAPQRVELPALTGEPPSPLDPPGGCTFHPRCPLAQAICAREAPALARSTRCAPGQRAACHLADIEG